MSVRAFPWASLDAWRRDDVLAWRSLFGWLRETIRIEDAERACSDVVGAVIGARLRRASRGETSRDLDDGVAVVLSRADNEANAGLVEVEGALAAALVARALKRPAARMTTGVATLPVAGAVAAILVATARRVHTGTPLRVLEAGPSASVGAAFRASRGELDRASFTVTVGEDAFLARLSRDARRPLTSPASWARHKLLTLGDMPLTIPVVAVTSSTSLAEIGTLREGDAWMPGRGALSPSLTGRVWLAGPTSEVGVAADLGERGRLVLLGEAKELSDVPMSDAKGNDALVEAVGEVPIVVRVEIGAATMTARQWAELQAGDVVALGRRIAEPVTLRVAGHEVGRGELVEIEGEVGVRILSRAAGSGTP